MRPDVISLRNFYDRPLGQMAAALIAREIGRIWPDLSGLHVAGIGFAPPILERIGDDAGSRVALMPGGQGVIHWPAPGLNAAALVEENELPLPASSFDRVILAHSVELADNLHGLLREVWRILSPGGRLIVVVPRRRGSWSGFERTPFGYGRPYSRTQLEKTLAGHLLPTARIAGALYLPPFERFGFPRALWAVEGLGSRWMSGFGGVLIVEAEKQIYRAVPNRPRRVRAAAAVAARPRMVPPLAPTARGPAQPHSPREKS